ncbi:hypothetical protein L1987_52348 [Smallanthus sonchifolius]|uniref:Uncharacterized protein n=1 Tax=Smallanthus sonchifolius TaxID=185202 RepID=A0ACB9ESY6_9ASTR|nr:hypothetical protein L1987_52348 [Smallanthus sonchifolius]
MVLLMKFKKSYKLKNPNSGLLSKITDLKGLTARNLGHDFDKEVLGEGDDTKLEIQVAGNFGVSPEDRKQYYEVSQLSKGRNEMRQTLPMLKLACMLLSSQMDQA